MGPPATSFNQRDLVDYESIHDVREEHWHWFIEAASPEDGDVILDCGSGYGACTRELLARCKESCFVVDLLDESPVQLNRARKKLVSVIERLGSSPSSRSVLSFITGTVSAFSKSSPRRYDKILLKMVLHEVPQERQQAFLDALYHLLKPGGVLLVWDLALDPSIAGFFREVVKEKDRLLDFNTMLERRYFLTASEFLEIVSASRFKLAETSHLFDCDFHTERRVECEFKGDIKTYKDWLTFLRERACKLDEQAKRALRIAWKDADGAHECAFFVIQRAIWRLRRPDCLSVFNTFSEAAVIEAHLAPSASRPDLAQHAQAVVRDGINALGLHELLPGHRGLVRVTTFHIGEKGKLVFSRDGTDYIYSNGPTLLETKGSFVLPLLAAYYRHMAYVYHRKALAADNGRTLTDYLNECGNSSPNASWLRIIPPFIDAGSGIAHIAVTLCQGSKSIADDVLLVRDYETAKRALVAAYATPTEELGCDDINGTVTRVVCGGDSNLSVDSVALEATHNLRVSPYTHPAGAFEWKHQRIRECPNDALLGFAVFLESSRLQNGFYVLPPTPLDGREGRAMPAAVFFSSDTKLTHHQEQVIFAFTSKMWSEMRGLQLLSQNHTFLNIAYREEILNRSTERLFFIARIFFPLLCGNKTTTIDPILLLQGVEPTTEPSIFKEWAAAQGRNLTAADLADLVQYVYSEDEGLSASERLTIAGVEHEIRDDAIAGLSDPNLIDRMVRAKEIAQRGGRLFTAVATLLESATTDVRVMSLPNAARIKCASAMEIVNELRLNSRKPIQRLCESNRKPPDRDSGYQSPSVSFRNGVFPRLRFPLSDLENAVSALRHNAIRWDSQAFSLRYSENSTSCDIVWLETTTERWTPQSFKAQLLASALQKGIHRGLPCVLLFGLESRAKKIEVLCDSGWSSLWPITDAQTKKEPEFETFNYGIRFVF